MHGTFDTASDNSGEQAEVEIERKSNLPQAIFVAKKES